MRYFYQLMIGYFPVYVNYVCVRYDTIRYDSVYLTCSKKLTGSQLSLPYDMNNVKEKKIKFN